MIEGYSTVILRRLSCGALLALAVLICGCQRQTQQAAKVDENAYRQEIDKWHKERAASLTSEEGWLTLVGLFWLKDGENRFGSDPSNQIVLPGGKAPKYAGSLWVEKGAVRLEAEPQAGITSEGKPVGTLALASDAEGKPTVLHLGTLSFNVIKRGDQLGLRVKDKESPARTKFAGLDYYPVALNWRIDARFEPYNPPKKIPIVNVLGMVEEQPSPGRIVFDAAGKTYSLDAISEEGSKELFVIFKDETSGRETYGAGRYLYTDPANAQGTVLLDFNKAYNPPCAFTNYATCPLPPSQNRLALRVEAGEKRYAQGH